MGVPIEELRITLALPADEVHWPQVLELLKRRQRIPFHKAGDMLKDFFERFYKSFNLYWFTHSKLSPSDNRLLAAVCECHGADIVRLTLDRPFCAGPLRFNYNQEIEFQPNLRNSDKRSLGKSKAVIYISLMRYTLRVDSLRQAFSIYLLLSLFGILTFAVAFGAFMYSLAVFLLFLEQPVSVTEAATSDPSIGLALLCFMTAFAAIFGRAISNLTKLLYGKIRHH